MESGRVERVWPSTPAWASGSSRLTKMRSAGWWLCAWASAVSRSTVRLEMRGLIQGAVERSGVGDQKADWSGWKFAGAA